MKAHLQPEYYQVKGSLLLRCILERGDSYKNRKKRLFYLSLPFQILNSYIEAYWFPKQLGYDYVYRILEKLTFSNYLIEDLKDRPQFMVFYDFGIFHKNWYEVKPQLLCWPLFPTYAT